MNNEYIDAKVPSGFFHQLGLLTIVVDGRGISHSHRDEGEHDTGDELHGENNSDVDGLGINECWVNESWRDCKSRPATMAEETD